MEDIMFGFFEGGVCKCLAQKGGSLCRIRSGDI